MLNSYLNRLHAINKNITLVKIYTKYYENLGHDAIE